MPHKNKECPKCGQDISHTYQGAEPDVGIMLGGWYCETCDVVVGEEDEPDDYDRSHRMELRRGD